MKAAETDEASENLISRQQKNMRLIAARGFVESSFKDYLSLIRTEFLLGTSRTDDDVISGKIKINHKSTLPMTEEDIELGIELGLRLREQNNQL